MRHHARVFGAAMMLAGLLMAGTALAQGVALVPATPVAAPSVPMDRGSALYGRPEGAEVARLAPVALPPIALYQWQ